MSRLIGLSSDPTADFRGRPGAKNAGLFAALDARLGVSEVLLPELSTPARRLRQLRAFHPRRERWRRRFNLHPSTFAARSRLAAELLEARRGSFELVVQLHTLLSPGLPPGPWPYVLHTDTTYLLTERHYPQGAPLRGRNRRRWLDLEGAVYRGAAVLYPRSEWLRRSLIGDYGCDPERVVAVGGGANLPPAELGGRRWDSRVALFVGKDGPRKGIGPLLETWPAVRGAVPGAELVVVGLPEAPKDLPAGVRWEGVVDDRQRLQGLYDEASAFVMPSLYEPWGHVFYEAMGRGLACIGTDTCAMPEIIEDGATGLLVPVGQAAPLGRALVRLLGDPAEAEAMGRLAHQQTLGSHGWTDVVDRMAPSLEAVLARGGRG